MNEEIMLNLIREVLHLKVSLAHDSRSKLSECNERHKLEGRADALGEIYYLLGGK
jgi:hypothetical protein